VGNQIVRQTLIKLAGLKCNLTASSCFLRKTGQKCFITGLEPLTPLDINKPSISLPDYFCTHPCYPDCSIHKSLKLIFWTQCTLHS
jgi:hypothetical protein